MTIGSLFAGVGGFDIAAERAGMRVAWQSENDKHAAAMLAEHWPDIPNYGDVHEIHIGEVDGTAGSVRGPGNAEPVDVLAGGFPCQSYSLAGHRGGLAEHRGELWWEFRRLIREGKPTWVVGENVPGLLSSYGGRDAATIIKSLVQLGYGVVWRVLDAQYFGVAQRRRRVFIVGHSGGQPRPEVLALAESLSGNPAPVREAGQKPAPTLSSRTRGGGGLGTDFEVDGGLVRVVGPLTAGMHREPRGTEAVDSGHSVSYGFVQNQRDEIRLFGGDGQTVGALPALPGLKQRALLAQTPEAYNVFPAAGQGADLQAKPTEIAMTLSSLNGQAHDRGTRIVQGAPQGVDLFNQTLTGDLHVPLRTAGGHGAPAAVDVPEPRVRRLTPLECERLQGFPDGWTEGQSDTQRYRQMGNAVAVPVAEWVMRRIVAIEQGEL